MLDAVTTAFSAYLPEDRLAELTGGGEVAQRGEGAVLFADVVGFTGLTTRLAQLYGPRRGAEEVPVYLNRLYEALNGEVQSHGGSVIGFAGDAITCWFSADDGRTAIACGLAMQRAMTPFGQLALGGAAKGESISLALKVAVTAGRVRRFTAGDAQIQLVDVIAGGPVAQIEALESVVRKGQVVVSPQVAHALEGVVQLQPVEEGDTNRACIVTGFRPGRAPNAEPGGRGATAPATDALARWLLPTVQRRLTSGRGDFLTELRPVAALFLSFDGIDLDEDPDAPGKFGQVVRTAQHVATDYGGNVLQVTSGDKGNYLYMAFGAPVSHEDDAPRCAAAALDLRGALQQLEFLTRLNIGLGYGTARTGAYGSGARRTYGALGEGTNMAARMMSVAPHASIYVSGQFADALGGPDVGLGGRFELTELQGMRVKGRSEPVRAYELAASVGVRPTEVGSSRGPLIGRAQELKLLQRNIGAAAGGEGRIVQLVADAGMGKSELLKHALANGENLRVVRGACQAFGRTAPYQLWKSVYHQLLGVAEDGAVGDRVAGTHAALGAIDEAFVAQAALLAPVLDLPLDSGQAPAAQDAEERSSARRTLLLTIFRHAARQTAGAGRTLVLLLEDVHWLDPASEELLVALGQTALALPVLVLTTARPPDLTSEPALGTLPEAETLELGPLSEEAATEVVTARLAAAPHLADHATSLAGPIVDRSGGNPFYLQELVTDLIQRSQAAGGAVDLVDELPTSLHSLILGRLDRLGDLEQVNVKVASVVGREFRTAWVSACQPGASEAASQEAFGVTDRVGLTQQLSKQPAVHEFNHAITHEVAYESQSHAGRSRLHTALAHFVEEAVASEAEPHLDLLAYHYSLGEDAGKARHYLSAAGESAKAAYANQAALHYFGLLLELQEGEEQLPTLLNLGEVASFVGSYPAAHQHLARALELAEEAGLDPERARALRLLGELHERQGDHEAARGRLEAAVLLCRQLDDSAELTRVLLALGGNVLWHLGAYDAAEAHLDEAVTLARAAGDVRAAARALHGAANIHMDLGKTEAAEAALAESLAMRRAAKDDYGVANALNNLAVVYAHTGDGARAEELFAESLSIRQRLGDASGVAVALNNLGYMAGERGDLVAARRLYEQSLNARRELGDKVGLAVSLNSLAGLLTQLHDTEAAQAAYLESARLAASIGNRREVAGALAGLSTVVPDDRDAARMVRAAELVLDKAGTAASTEVSEQLERGKARSGTVTAPAELTGAPLTEVLNWALAGSEQSS